MRNRQRQLAAKQFVKERRRAPLRPGDVVYRKGQPCTVVLICHDTVPPHAVVRTETGQEVGSELDKLSRDLPRPVTPQPQKVEQHTPAENKPPVTASGLSRTAVSEQDEAEQSGNHEIKECVNDRRAAMARLRERRAERAREAAGERDQALSILDESDHGPSCLRTPRQQPHQTKAPAEKVPMLPTFAQTANMSTTLKPVVNSDEAGDDRLHCTGDRIAANCNEGDQMTTSETCRSPSPLSAAVPPTTPPSAAPSTCQKLPSSFSEAGSCITPHSAVGNLKNEFDTSRCASACSSAMSSMGFHAVQNVLEEAVEDWLQHASLCDVAKQEVQHGGHGRFAKDSFEHSTLSSDFRRCTADFWTDLYLSMPKAQQEPNVRSPIAGRTCRNDFRSCPPTYWTSLHKWIAHETPSQSAVSGSGCAGSLRGDFRRCPDDFWAALNGKMPHAHKAAAHVHNQDGSVRGDFRRCPDSYWSALNAELLHARKAATSSTAPSTAAAADNSRGDFRSCPSDYWADLSSRFAHHHHKASFVSGLQTAELPSMFHNDFRTCPAGYWNHLHDAFRGTSKKVEAPVASGPPVDVLLLLDASYAMQAPIGLAHSPVAEWDEDAWDTFGRHLRSRSEPCRLESLGLTVLRTLAKALTGLAVEVRLCYEDSSATEGTSRECPFDVDLVAKRWKRMLRRGTSLWRHLEADLHRLQGHGLRAAIVITGSDQGNDEFLNGEREDLQNAMADRLAQFGVPVHTIALDAPTAADCGHTAAVATEGSCVAVNFDQAAQLKNMTPPGLARLVHCLRPVVRPSCTEAPVQKSSEIKLTRVAAASRMQRAARSRQHRRKLSREREAVRQIQCAYSRWRLRRSLAWAADEARRARRRAPVEAAMQRRRVLQQEADKVAAASRIQAEWRARKMRLWCQRIDRAARRLQGWCRRRWLRRKLEAEAERLQARKCRQVDLPPPPPSKQHVQLRPRVPTVWHHDDNAQPVLQIASADLQSTVETDGSLQPPVVPSAPPVVSAVKAPADPRATVPSMHPPAPKGVRDSFRTEAARLHYSSARAAGTLRPCPPPCAPTSKRVFPHRSVSPSPSTTMVPTPPSSVLPRLRRPSPRSRAISERNSLTPRSCRRALDIAV